MYPYYMSLLPYTGHNFILNSVLLLRNDKLKKAQLYFARPRESNPRSLVRHLRPLDQRDSHTKNKNSTVKMKVAIDNFAEAIFFLNARLTKVSLLPYTGHNFRLRALLSNFRKKLNDTLPYPRIESETRRPTVALATIRLPRQSIIYLLPHSETFNDYLNYSLVTILYRKQLLRTGLNNH
ncbi:hypothetical protein SFRURICE_013253 [Spodoptera frugiperda]|nr:hypothetical protein SFRURICE_013253 [Spodoptera frugiperda]